MVVLEASTVSRLLGDAGELAQALLGRPERLAALGAALSNLGAADGESSGVSVEALRDALRLAEGPPELGLAVELFAALDTDGSGSIAVKEIRSALRSEGRVAALIKGCPALRGLLRPKAFKAAFELLDADGDGSCSEEELVATLVPSAERRLVLELFELLGGTADGRGRVGTRQLRKAVREDARAVSLIRSSPRLAGLLKPRTFRHVREPAVVLPPLSGCSRRNGPCTR